MVTELFGENKERLRQTEIVDSSDGDSNLG